MPHALGAAGRGVATERPCRGCQRSGVPRVLSDVTRDRDLHTAPSAGVHVTTSATNLRPSLHSLSPP